MDAIQSLKYFLPESFLLAGAFLVLLMDLITQNKKIVGLLSLLILGLFLCLAKAHAQTQTLSLFFGTFTLDGLTQFVRYLAGTITFITLLISLNYRKLPKAYQGEYYTLFLFMTFALILTSAASNLLMIFLSMEFVSILSYLMVGLLKKDARSKEAAIKYLLFGSAASAIMLYGISLLFGLSGSLDFRMVQQSVATMPQFFSITLIALIFFLVGLGFKISMAPFHMWAPDVYEAAPTPVTAFLTVAPKAVGMIALIRVLGIALEPLNPHWQQILVALSILTMTIGNLSAIAQTNIKRLIAYSSIAQAGYILMGLAVFGSLGIQSVLIYLATYALTNLGVFTAIVIVSNQTGSDEISSYAGLAKRSPFVAASLTVFLVSLAGIPPVAGFIGKWFVFASTVQNGFYVLAIAAALNSAVAAYYYFKIVKAMYLTPSDMETPVFAAPALRIALVTTLCGVILFGIIPHSLIGWIQQLQF